MELAVPAGSDADLLSRLAQASRARLGSSLARIPDPTVAALLAALPSLAADVARSATESILNEQQAMRRAEEC